MKKSQAALALLLVIAECAPANNTDGGFKPFTPPETDHPVIDRPYLQEFNHTANEVEPGIGALVSVLIPPAGLSGFETPTQVTPRGLVTHDDQQRLQMIEIDAAEPGLLTVRSISPAPAGWHTLRPGA
ncbi:MAG TPA: hypothetical protein VM425_22090 [Myxococcota bacterium]|nr:hypothetical protein [Myxococcota bacterium]